MREYRRVPALESGSKLSNPDLQDIGEKNYTDIILRYGNLTTRFPQLDTNAKTIVAAINELYAHPGGTTVIPNPLDNQILTESGESLELEQGGILQTEQGGGGTIVGPLNSISIDGDIYTIDGGGTSVVANPDNLATDKLRKLQVDTTTYSVTNVTSVQINLRIEAWSSGTQSITIQGITSKSVIWVSPVPSSDYNYDEYLRCGIKATMQATDRLTFEYKTEPAWSIDVIVCFCEPIN